MRRTSCFAALGIAVLHACRPRRLHRRQPRARKHLGCKGCLQRPEAFIPDNTFLNYLFTSGRCDITDNGTNSVPLESQAYDWRLLRTEAPVSDKGKIAKTALEKIRLKVSKSSPPLAVDREVIVTGGWFEENHNGEPDDTDDLGCNGYAETSLAIQAK